MKFRDNQISESVWILARKTLNPVLLVINAMESLMTENQPNRPSEEKQGQGPIYVLLK